MKKLLTFCIVLICTMSFSAFVNAQGSGTAPSIGSTHQYWVNSGDNGATQNVGTGNNFLWYVTKGDLTTKNTSDFSIVSAVSGGTPAYVNNTTSVTNLFTVNITWKAASAGSTYYLHVMETGTNGCSNHKVEIINPVSDFRLAIANVDEGALGTVVAQNFNNCAPNVAPALVSNSIRYDYGKTKLYYKVDATNIDAADFSFVYNITKTGGPTTISASYGTVSGNTYTSSGTLDVTSGNHTQSVTNTSNSATVYIEVVLDNNNGSADFVPATVFEGTSAHNVKVTLISGAQSVATATITDGNSETSDDDYRNQNIQARPSTTGIGSN
jgi:hypothetical protein